MLLKTEFKIIIKILQIGEDVSLRPGALEAGQQMKITFPEERRGQSREGKGQAMRALRLPQRGWCQLIPQRAAKVILVQGKGCQWLGVPIWGWKCGGERAIRHFRVL